MTANIKSPSSVRALKKQIKDVFLPFTAFLMVVGVSTGLLLVQTPMDLRQQAAYESCISPATTIMSGVDVGGCRCPSGQVINVGQQCPSNSSPTPLAQEPTSRPSPTIFYGTQPQPTPKSSPVNSFCIPGSTTCTNGFMSTCTNNDGTYSNYRCPYGCDGNACSLQSKSKVSSTPTPSNSKNGTGGLSNSCVPGSSLCIDSVRYTCTISNGTYSSIPCQNGCDGNTCALPKSTPTSRPLPTITENPITVSQLNTQTTSDICASKGGVRAIAGCFNTSDMKYWCNNPGTSEIKTCDTGRGTCRNNECRVNSATLTPVPTPTLGPIEEFLDSKPHFSGGFCKCYMDRNGEVSSREYICKNQSLCCGDSVFNNTTYGQSICSGNLSYLIPQGSEIRPNLFLQTNPELVSYDPNFTAKGCGPTVVTNICLEAKQDNCSIDEIAESAQLGPNGTTFENILSTLNDLGLPSEYLFAENSASGKAYPIQLNQPLSNVSEKYMDDMEKQTAEGNILVAHIVVNGIDHLVYFDRCVNKKCKGVDTYFQQDNSEINYTGQAYTIEFWKWENATLVEVAVVEMPDN